MTTATQNPPKVTNQKKQIYVASCIENGARFTFLFKTTQTEQKQLFKIGQEEASGWGGECISIKRWQPKRFVKVLDCKTGKVIETTEKKWENWQAKSGDSIVIVDSRNGKRVQTSRLRYENWLRKNFPGGNSPYTIDEKAKPSADPRYQFKEYSFEEPGKDIWDADVSTEENLKNYHHKKSL